MCQDPCPGTHHPRTPGLCEPVGQHRDGGQHPGMGPDLGMGDSIQGWTLVTVFTWVLG